MHRKGEPIIERLLKISYLVGADSGDFIRSFNDWRRFSDLGQVLNFESALRACERAAAAGKHMPWDQPQKAENASLPFRVVDADNEPWSAKDRRLDPVKGCKRTLPRCCASCKFLTDLPKFGPPECRRPGGPVFDGPRAEMLYHICALWRRGRNQAETDKLLNGQ